MKNLKINRKLALLFLFIVGTGYGFSNFHRSSMAVLTPYFIETLGITTEQIGTISSILFYSYGAAQIPIGILSRKYGSKVVVLGSSILLTLGTLLFALADSYTMLLISRTIIGLASAGYFVPSLSLVRQWFPLEQLGFYNSILIAQGSVWTLLSYGPLEYLITNNSIRTVFFIITALTAIVAFGSFFIIEEEPDIINEENIEQNSTVPTMYWVVLVAASLQALTANGARQAFQTTWAVTYYTEIFKIGLNQATRLLTVFTLSGLIAGPVLGKISEKLGGYKSMISINIVAVIVWISMGFVPPTSKDVVITLMTSISGAIFINVMNYTFTTIGDISPPSLNTLSSGVINTMAYFGGAIYIQAVAKALSNPTIDQYLFRTIFSTFGALIAGAIIIFIISYKIFSKSEARR